MSMLNTVSDFTSTPSIKGFARGFLRFVNNVVAAIIAQRERQATLEVLRRMSDRELRDVGIARNQIGAGLALAARDRTQMQQALARRS